MDYKEEIQHHGTGKSEKITSKEKCILAGTVERLFIIKKLMFLLGVLM
jgi:hypothetical protein